MTDTAHPVFTDGDGITVVDQEWLGDRLVELRLGSGALVRPVGVRILVPAGYDPASGARHPVLSLLHGGLGGFRDWTDQGDVAAHTDGLDLIVVMPYGGLGGWYRDWHNFGRGGAPMWETFHIRQLIPWVDHQLATRADGSGRAIAGLSMGGYGALSYAARNPGTFAAAASFSGAVHTSFPSLQVLISVSPRAQHRMPFAINRLPLLGRSDWHAHNPWHLAESLRGMHLAITTGDGRPTRFHRRGDPRSKDLQEHQVRAMTHALHRRFDELDIEHTFRDYGNVGHVWENWQRAFTDELPSIMQVLGDSSPAD